MVVSFTGSTAGIVHGRVGDVRDVPISTAATRSLCRGVQQVLRREFLWRHAVGEPRCVGGEKPVHTGGLLVENPGPTRQVTIVQPVVAPVLRGRDYLTRKLGS